jgi:pimeloyl-ACP methyl ester carboxylesterase
MTFFETPQARIYYETHGSQGPWITLVNGHTRTSKDFRVMTKFLVENDYRVLVLDNRGSGQTEISGEFQIDDMAEDVLALWSQLNVRSSSLLGISMGGLIAIYLAAHRPSMVERLILVSTASDRKWFLKVPGWGETLESVQERLNHYVNPDFVKSNKILLEAMAKQILTAIISGKFTADSNAQNEAIKSFDPKDHLGNISSPCLIIHGEKDAIIAPESAKELHHLIQDSRLHLMPGIGHLILAESPKQLYNLVLDFLKE